MQMALEGQQRQLQQDCGSRLRDWLGGGHAAICMGALAMWIQVWRRTIAIGHGIMHTCYGQAHFRTTHGKFYSQLMQGVTIFWCPPLRSI